MEDNDVVQALAALAEPLGVPAATFSFHLKELVHGGLVSCERSGRNLIYRADFSQMQALLAYLTSHRCEGDTCDVALPPSCQSGKETA